MKAKFICLTMLAMLCFWGRLQAQEKGVFRNNPKIKSSKNTPAAKPQRDEFEEFENEAPKTRFTNQFEPQKEVNLTVAEDTSSIDEGQTSVVEIIDSVQVGEDWVQVADYYAIWDSKTINPYNLRPLDFEENITLQLYESGKGRFWNLPTSETKVTSVFGPRWGRWHEGMDLDLNTGDPVFSTYDGIVRVVAYDGNGYGRFVLVRHYNGLETLYGHLSKTTVEPMQLVKAGDMLGLGGNTGRSYGDHLHYENRYEGNPFSPALIWDFPHQAIRNQRFVLSSRAWDHLRGGRSVDAEFDLSKASLKRTVLHRVQRGETLASIASKYGLSTAVLAKKNRIRVSHTLRAGQRIKVK
ncbi:MAG: LysM peptidoglycan-binding domain-containing protein [Cytophagia bacterium]|nr:MAG: LysM peptidoglycan-binding domain-containing protein [Runella sp.]TAG23734.1 MAG: LysM peptidoglycan-binding domain-containing protein [Cytophagales bacterium]TAG43006.1 MAG: LysM peptidoglycan-binding domain-containing protein [Cytophagia bacterium]TAG56442.1 MAG: LysM peptidoglycan-binding domain-containing protein [Runella slithyformis]TAG76476.1 MAG: LysM peptidoglycan-binding domain-containing protein [Cytophagales bacterium]